MQDNVVIFPQANGVRIMPVLPEQVEQYIDAGMELLRPAIKRQEMNVTEDVIAQEIRDGQSLLWLVYLGDTLTAAITTAVITHPRRSVLKIEFLGGTRMNEWVGVAADFLAEMARKAGLPALEADGRKGFEKIASGLRFKPITTNYVMELD